MHNLFKNTYFNVKNLHLERIKEKRNNSTIQRQLLFTFSFTYF